VHLGWRFSLDFVLLAGKCHVFWIGSYSLQSPLSLFILQAIWLFKSQLSAAISHCSTPLQFCNLSAMAEQSSIEKGAFVQDSSVSSPGSTAEVTFDPVAERKLLRKLDLRILPVLWILYLVNFIDR
jgi:hypothetical protein